MIKLKYYRKRAGISQAELASRTGLSGAYISELESGKKGKQQIIKTAKSLASALEIEWTLLFEDEGKEEPA